MTHYIFDISGTFFTWYISHKYTNTHMFSNLENNLRFFFFFFHFVGHFHPILFTCQAILIFFVTMPFDILWFREEERLAVACFYATRASRRALRLMAQMRLWRKPYIFIYVVVTFVLHSCSGYTIRVFLLKKRHISKKVVYVARYLIFLLFLIIYIYIW